MSKLLTLKGRYAEGLQIDRRLVQLCSSDPLAHYKPRLSLRPSENVLISA